jgi:hypothetical protein
MSRSSRLTAQIRILTAAISLAALATILSCGENPIAPGEGSTLINANGSLQTIYHYPDSVVHPASDRDPSITPNLLTSGAEISPAASVSATGPTYTVTSVPFAPEVAPTTGPNAPTQEFAVSQLPIPIGFTFSFFGNNYTELQIGAGGIIGFGNGNIRDGCCSGRFIPRVDPFYKNLIAVGWSLWVLNSKSIRYETRGTVPNRRFVIQFNNLTEDGGTGVFTAQLILYEHSNDIVMYTTALSTSAKSHAITQGIENLTGTEAAFVAGRDSARFAIANDGVKFSLVAVNTPPIVTAPKNLIVDMGAGVCAANVTLVAPTVVDDAPGATVVGVRSDGLALNAPYPKGVTTITYTATDVAGLSSSATQTVTVNDKQNPSILAPAAVNVRADKSVSLATIDPGAPTASDNCPDVKVSSARSDNAPLAARFPLGVTTITWTATDASNNTASATQTISVRPNQAPAFSFVPASLSMNTDERVCSARRDVGMATATDDLDGVAVSFARSDAVASLAEPFPRGVTTITWTATDVEGSTASATQTVTVTDNELPSIHAPANVAVRTDINRTPVNVEAGNPIATDNCLNPVVNGVRSDNQPLWAPYPAGITTITWTAADASNNKSSATQTVTVTPNVAPVLSVPASLSVNTDGGVCYANVSVASATATDDLDGVVVSGARNDGKPLNASYPKGVTEITWTATDVEGATASGVQNVTVSDKEVPSLFAPDNVSVRTDPGLPSAQVSVGSARAEDNCPSVTVNAERSDNLSLSSPFPVGSTTIRWSATDASNNKASAIQTVVVRDEEAPVLSVPADFAVNATMPSGAVVTYAIQASDNVGVTAASCDRASGSVFPVGYSEVHCSARDAAGNVTLKNFGVQVVDAHQQVQTLMDFVISLNLPNGSQNPLVNQLRAAYRDGSDPAVCTKMDDFIHMVGVKDGSYSDANASFMVNEANRIEVAFGCKPPAPSVSSAGLRKVPTPVIVRGVRTRK